MKLNKKIFMISAATLMLVSPVMANTSQAATIPSYMVRKGQKGKLTLSHNSYVYTKKGKRTGKLLRKGKSVKYVGKVSVNNEAASLYFYQRSTASNKMQLKTTRIKGKNYYQIGKNQYISVANVSTIDGSSVFAKQTTVTVKRTTPQLFMAPGNRALTTGKNYKKGQKLTVDQLGGMNVLANSLLDAYHIKGTDYYVRASDVTARQDLVNMAYGERNQTTVRTNRVSVPIYSFNGEESTPNGFAWIKGTDLHVNGAMYLYNGQTQKSELYYHLINRYQFMPNLKRSPNFPEEYRANYVNIGDAFVKASDVTWTDGERLTPINTADEAENNSKIAITETNELDLKDLINKADSMKNTVKYKLSSFYKRYNYDQAIRDAQTEVNSRKLMSTAEAQYLIWNLKTYENELDGAKIKVANMNKLTSNEKLAIDLLVDKVCTQETDTENLAAEARFSKGNNKSFTLVIEDEKQNNKVISTKTMKISDFAEKR